MKQLEQKGTVPVYLGSSVRLNIICKINFIWYAIQIHSLNYKG
jgi:hypothetical protein